MNLQLSDFQRRALEAPEEFDLFLGGGRGGGKSYTLALVALRHAEQYEARARVLYIRPTYKGLMDFELVTRELFGTVYGTGARFNAAEHVWRLPNGAYLELGQLESASDYAKYQGRSCGLRSSHQPGGENSATGRFLWAVGRQTGVPVAARNEAPPTPDPKPRNRKFSLYALA